MTLQSIRIVRAAIGVTAAVALSYGAAWPLHFVTPIFAALFLLFPVWIGWNKGVQLLGRLAFSLIIGLIISEFFLGLPLICIPLLGLLLFVIYYHDTPAAPPLAALFMTIGVTMVPIIGLSGREASHVIAAALLFNMAAGLAFAWVFHRLFADSLAAPSQQQPPKSPPSPPEQTRQERTRLALVSTSVALSAVLIFFAFNLAQYALAMLYICIAAGTPNTAASLQVMKANALATCIGGLAIIVAFNLLVAVPTYPFLVTVVLAFSLFFAGRIFAGGRHAAAFTSGYTTFLVLLGSSTGVDNVATDTFYLRIAQVLFAGLFTTVMLKTVEHLFRTTQWALRPGSRRA